MKKNTAFFSTNDAQVEPLLKKITELGGYYVQTDSPLQGYAGALGIDLSKEKGDWKAILAKIEKAVVAKGGKGRLATWPIPLATASPPPSAKLASAWWRRGRS